MACCVRGLLRYSRDVVTGRVPSVQAIRARLDVGHGHSG